MAHNCKIQDTETHFIIDPGTRAITNSSSENNIIVQHDHNSERFTFEMKRYVDGHDMSGCTHVRIHYINSDPTNWKKTNGVYVPDDVSISEDDENVLTFSWLLSSATTQYVGYLYFSIQFVCLDGETVEYAWNTAICKDITVVESINNIEEIIIDNIDALTAYRNEIISEVSAGITNGRISYITLLADGWFGEDGTYSQVVELDGVTKNSQVELMPSVEQLLVFHEKDVTFVTENNGGIITVYAIGQKPKNDYTMQVTIKEVAVE